MPLCGAGLGQLATHNEHQATDAHRRLTSVCGRPATILQCAVSWAAIEVLTDLLLRHIPASYIRSDNGLEFVVAAVRRWIAGVPPRTAFIEPGLP